MKFRLENNPPETQAVVTNSKVGTLDGWLAEIDGYFSIMEKFGEAEPDQIFSYLSSWTARASHMRSMINRSESKIAQGFRTKQIDPFINECDRQFKLWSRVFSVQSLDWNMQRNMT